MTIHAVFFDLAGVLYDGDTLIPGAIETVDASRQRQLSLRFVTNTATQSRQQILSKLQHMGFQLDAQELFTAPDAASAYIHHHQLNPYALVHAHIRDQFPVQGEPDCVVLGDAREDLNYANLNRAFRLLMQGKPLISIGDNKYFMDKDGLSLDTGAFTQALSWASGCRAIVMGKPSTAFFDEVVASVGDKADHCLMIGDDVFGDIEGARNAGLQACLVKTGKYQAGDESKLSPPAQTLDSVSALPEWLDANP